MVTLVGAFVGAFGGPLVGTLVGSNFAFACSARSPGVADARSHDVLGLEVSVVARELT